MYETSYRVFLMIGCSISGHEKISVQHIEGLWRYAQPNGEYAEWIMTDKLLWTYSDLDGTWQFDYNISNDSLILWHSDAPYDTMIIEKVNLDTLWFSKPKLICYRVEGNFYADELIAGDNEAIDIYVKDFRARRKIYEKK